MREAGKPWAEADGDVCEAIDFLEYYAHGALALDGGRPLLQMPGERNAMRYVARGITGVIAPWNFPLAIAAGMVSAALATGNAVVLKPAEQAPACAKAVVDALHAGGVPLDALSMLPGGDEPGKALVADPRIHTIVFTGSCAAGLNILETAAKVVPGQRHIKRVIAEMGGKNAVIVDSDADLDDVVPGLLKSAFAFAGQKCSAASRALVHRRVADELAERLAGALTTLRVGPAADFGTDVPPVIDIAAQQRIQSYIEAPRRSRRARRATTASTSPPTIFHDLPGRLAGHQRGDLRPGALAGDGREHRARVRARRRAPVRAHRRPVLPLARARSSTSPTARRSATSTSTARSRARWSAASRSAAGACRAPAPRRAVRTTCCSSSRRARSPRTRCATAWWSDVRSAVTFIDH